MFKVGDYIRGTLESDAHYSFTNSYMTKGIVTKVSSYDPNDISVKILEHSRYQSEVGCEYGDIDARYFVLFSKEDTKKMLKEQVKAIRDQSVIKFMEDNFEATSEGYIVYKTFGEHYTTPEYWNVKSGSVIEETPNYDRGEDCGAGVNVGTLKWVKANRSSLSKPIWKCLIEYKWLAGVVVPRGTEGKIRCERVKLLCKI